MISLRSRTPSTVTWGVEQPLRVCASRYARASQSKLYTLYIFAPHIHPPPVAPLLRGQIMYTWGVEQPLRVSPSRFARDRQSKLLAQFLGASPSRGSTPISAGKRKDPCVCMGLSFYWRMYHKMIQCTPIFIAQRLSNNSMQ